MKTLSTHIQESIQSVNEDENETSIFEIEVSSSAAPNIRKLLQQLKNLGDIGSSRTITVEAINDEGDLQLYFDGDGSDKILSFKENGKDID